MLCYVGNYLHLSLAEPQSDDGAPYLLATEFVWLKLLSYSTITENFKIKKITSDL